MSRNSGRILILLGLLGSLIFGCHEPSSQLADTTIKSVIELNDSNAGEVFSFHKTENMPMLIQFYTPDCQKCESQVVVLRNLAKNSVHGSEFRIYRTNLAESSDSTKKLRSYYLNGSYDLNYRLNNLLFYYDYNSSANSWEITEGNLSQEILSLSEIKNILRELGVKGLGVDFNKEGIADLTDDNFKHYLHNKDRPSVILFHEDGNVKSNGELAFRHLENCKDGVCPLNKSANVAKAQAKSASVETQDAVKTLEALSYSKGQDYYVAHLDFGQDYAETADLRTHYKKAFEKGKIKLPYVGVYAKNYHKGLSSEKLTKTRIMGLIAEAQKKLGMPSSSEDKKDHDTPTPGETDNAKKQILVFSAPWCGACTAYQNQTLSTSAFKKAYTENNWNYRKVNTDNEKAITAQYNIQSLPTTVMIVNGKVVRRLVGVQSVNTLKAELEKHDD